jgi:hypothetical protein
LSGAAAGAAAAAVWAVQEPLDMRVFGVPYSDTELLGRAAVPNGDGWRAPGLVLHLGNGAIFGAAYAAIAPRLPGPGVVKGAGAGMVENLATWPLTSLVPRRHPAARKIPQLYGNRPAFWQAVWRHLLFGAVLGGLEERLRRGYSDRTPG